MAPSSSNRWQHWLASLVLLVVYCPSNVIAPWVFHDLLGRWAEVAERWFALCMLISFIVVNASLMLTAFAAQRFKPRTLWVLRAFLLVYALPHLLLVSVWMPFSSSDAWVP